MLRKDVVEAVAEGRFHIYAVDTIDEGIETLTGLPAGQQDAEGNYPDGSVNAKVQARLRDLAKKRKEASSEVKGEGNAS
jgi:predicted ATP-dependent protease